MDIVYTNKIAGKIHGYCLKLHATPETYTSDPVRFRQNIENCFLNIIDQHKQVMNGIDSFMRTHSGFK